MLEGNAGQGINLNVTSYRAWIDDGHLFVVGLLLVFISGPCCLVEAKTISLDGEIGTMDDERPVWQTRIKTSVFHPQKGKRGCDTKKPNPFSDIAGPVLQFWGTGWARRSGWGSGHTFGTHEVKNIHSDSAVPVGYFLLPLYMILTSYCLWMDGCRSSDHDIKSISQDLFRALTLNQKVRPLLEHHFRHLLPEWQLSPQVTYHLLLLRNCFTLIWSKLVRSKL